MAYTKSQQDGGAKDRDAELKKRDEEATTIRRNKAAARKGASSANGSIGVTLFEAITKERRGVDVSQSNRSQSAPKPRTSRTRTVPAGRYRTQIEQILGSDADTLARLGSRLSTSITGVAQKHNWASSELAAAYAYAIYLVYGEGDADQSAVSTMVRRTVEKRFATSVWHMRNELAQRKMYPHGVTQPFFAKDYADTKQHFGTNS